MSTAILLVDDHRMMRDGLRAVIEKEAEMRLVGEAENGRKAVELTRELVPDVVVMDVGMPDMNGIEATRRILAENPDVKVIALSTHDDERYVHAILDAGASGYVLKKDASDDLLRAIEAATSGKYFLSPGITGLVVRDRAPRSQETSTSAGHALSPREREVLQLLAEGKTSREIAAALSRSVKTVETQRREIMRKLDIHSVAELTKYAVREGLTGLEP
ncbi:MAG: response regulator transcription factor [Phycisphaerae bacterium]|nr:response regulator transcription factor [Phycisphaerae bacterium]